MTNKRQQQREARYVKAQIQRGLKQIRIWVPEKDVEQFRELGKKCRETWNQQ